MVKIMPTDREKNSCQEKLRFLVHTAGCQAEKKRSEVNTLLEADFELS